MLTLFHACRGKDFSKVSLLGQKMDSLATNSKK